MAQSRFHRIGTVYSRMSALIDAGAVKTKPVWFDVYTAFPPKYEPRYDQNMDNEHNKVRPILYNEDLPRAEFYRQFGDRHQVFSLLSECPVSNVCEKFVDKFGQLEKEMDGHSNTLDDVFVASVQRLREEEGVDLLAMDKEMAMDAITNREQQRPRRQLTEPKFAFADVFKDDQSSN